uniref:Uncharacterized protein n=1 Tax=Haptolina brevifila TaxID=156173 RepID=A0A7S2NLC5_9EUKA
MADTDSGHPLLILDEYALFLVACAPLITIAMHVVPMLMERYSSMASAADTPELSNKEGSMVKFGASVRTRDKRSSVGNNRFMARQVSRNYMARSMDQINDEVSSFVKDSSMKKAATAKTNAPAPTTVLEGAGLAA